MLHRRHPWALLLLVGCSEPTTSDLDANVVDAPAPLWTVARPPLRASFESITTSSTFPIALDPRLPGFEPIALEFETTALRGASCTVTIARGTAMVRELTATIAEDDLCSAHWDGTDQSGAVVPPGRLTVSATVNNLDAHAAIEVLRLGISEIDLAGEGRAAVLYGAMDSTRYGYYEVAADTVPWRIGPDASEAATASPLDLADGTVRPLPMPWDDLRSPPLDASSTDGAEHDTYNLPTAWVAGSTIGVHVVFSTAWHGLVADPVTVEVRLVPPPGLSAHGDAIVEDGVGADLTTTSSWVPSVSRYDVALSWRFEARAQGGEWRPLSGAIPTTHRFYGLVAAPIFDYRDVPHRAWVEVLDRVSTWVDGASADPDRVAALLVEGIFNTLGLQYDNVRGASYYTDYPGSSFADAEFTLSRFSDQADGNIINCSDAASILSSFANMVGIDLRYHILRHHTESGFALNYLDAIGRGFASAPFTSGRASFSYHAITGPPDTRVFDATLALDGDGDPTAPPNTMLMVEGLSQADYLVGLSPESDQIDVSLDQKVRIR